MKPSEITYKSVQSKIDQNQVQTKNPRKWTYIGTYGRRLRIKVNINPVMTLKYASYDLLLMILTNPDPFMNQVWSKSCQISHLNFSVFVLQRFNPSLTTIPHHSIISRLANGHFESFFVNLMISIDQLAIILVEHRFTISRSQVSQGRMLKLINR